MGTNPDIFEVCQTADTGFDFAASSWMREEKRRLEVAVRTKERQKGIDEDEHTLRLPIAQGNAYRMLDDEMVVHGLGWVLRRRCNFELRLRIAGRMHFRWVESHCWGRESEGVLVEMGGKGSIAAWRWLFRIEGTFTVVIALLVMMVLPDYLNLTQWLSETEQFIAQKWLVDDVSAADEDDSEEGKFSWPETRGSLIPKYGS
jgi:hypothetical protein